MQVMELSNRGDARADHFEKGRAGHIVKLLGRDEIRGAIHLLPPGPEGITTCNTALGPSPEKPLKRMRVRICQARKQRLAAEQNKPCVLWRGFRCSQALHKAGRIDQQANTRPGAPIGVEYLRQIEGT